MADYRSCGLVSAVYVNHTTHPAGLRREKEKRPKDYYDETKLNLCAGPSTPLHFGY